MSERNLDYTALRRHLQSLEYLFIDVTRLQMDDEYDEKEGGYGDVKFSILDSEIKGGRRVATKTLRLKNKHKQHGRIAFSLVRELKVWANLQHPNILPLLGYYLNDELTEAILISEYMVHGDLGEYIEQEHPSWTTCLSLVIDATKGLHYLHTREPPICHADIKTNNVLVNRHRRGLLSDFGLSKALDERPSGLTTTTELRGTPCFWSPELITEINPQYTLASDIWAWACLMLQVLTNKLPHEGVTSHIGIYTRLISGEQPCDVDHISIPIPGIKRLLAECWAIDPRSRPSAFDCLCYISSILSTVNHSSSEFEAEILQLRSELWEEGYRLGENGGTNHLELSPPVQSSKSQHSADIIHPSIPNVDSLSTFDVQQSKNFISASITLPSGVRSAHYRGSSGPEYPSQAQIPPVTHLPIAKAAGALSNSPAPNSNKTVKPPPLPQGPSETSYQAFRSMPPQPPAWPTSAPSLETHDSDYYASNGIGSILSAQHGLHQDQARQETSRFSSTTSQQEAALRGESYLPYQNWPQHQPPQQNQMELDPRHDKQHEVLNARIPGLGQMERSTLVFMHGQQPFHAHGAFQSHGPDKSAFLEQIVNLPIDAFRSQLVSLKTKTKLLEDQRDIYLQVKTPHTLSQALNLQVHIHELESMVRQLTEAYRRRQATAMGQEGGQPSAIGPLAGANQVSFRNLPRIGDHNGGLGGVAQDPLEWPASSTPQMAHQLNRENLQPTTIARTAGLQQQQQQQQQLQQAPSPPRVPSIQLDASPTASHWVSQQPQPSQTSRPMQFNEFFTAAFNDWLDQRQLTLDPPRVDGKEVELHKLFLMVGVFGGCSAVFEKKLWPVVGAMIGFPYFNGPFAYSKPEVADQLSEIYLTVLADFETHWHNSLRLRDPTSIFPLPPQLQYLHPEFERLATAQFPLQRQPRQEQQQRPRPLGAGQPQQPDANARGPTLTQMGQQTPQMGQTQAATQRQEAIMRNQSGVAFPPQPGPSAQEGPTVLPVLPNLPPMLQQLFANPDILKLSPGDLKRRGLSDEVIQKVLVYRQHVAAKQIQTRKEHELMLQQQRQIQAQQAANLLNSQKETPQLAPGSRPSPALGGPQIGLGPVQLPQPSSNVPLLPGLNIPQDQLMKAQEKVRAAIGLFHNKRDYSSINLPHEEGILLEQSIQQTQSLLKQVAQNLVSFVALAPDDERELHRIAQTVVTLSDQAQILQKPPPEKRFIFGLGDLNNYRNHFTTFLMRVKGLQGQALALQNQATALQQSKAESSSSDPIRARL